MTITDRAMTSERLNAAVAFLAGGMTPTEALEHAGSSLDELRDADNIVMPEANTFRVTAIQQGHDDWLVLNLL
jgi:hypothetical protein